MASASQNGITVYYPDDPCLIFNPCTFRLYDGGGTLARTRVYISHGGQSYNATYQTPGGGTLDLSAYMQAFFDGLTFGADLENINVIKVSELGKTVNLTLFALQADGTTIAQFNVSVFCVWGGMAINEEYEKLNTTDTIKLTWFRNYPLTVGLYSSSARLLSYDYYTDAPNDGNIVRSVAIPAKGLYNIAIDSDGLNTANYLIIEDSGSPYTVHYLIKICRKANEGVYLRWVDRHGFWRYWLFKQGDPTRAVASKFGMWNRNNYTEYNAEDGWQQDSGRRQSFTRNDVQPLCAPLVNQETFDMLQDVTTSPVIDMFLGYDQNDLPRWTAVTVEPGSYTKDFDKPEQDFIFNLVLPEIPIQQL